MLLGRKHFAHHRTGHTQRRILLQVAHRAEVPQRALAPHNLLLQPPDGVCPLACVELALLSPLAVRFALHLELGVFAPRVAPLSIEKPRGLGGKRHGHALRAHLSVLLRRLPHQPPQLQGSLGVAGALGVDGADPPQKGHRLVLGRGGVLAVRAVCPQLAHAVQREAHLDVSHQLGLALSQLCLARADDFLTSVECRRRGGTQVEVRGAFEKCLLGGGTRAQHLFKARHAVARLGALAPLLGGLHVHRLQMMVELQIDRPLGGEQRHGDILLHAADLVDLGHILPHVSVKEALRHHPPPRMPRGCVTLAVKGKRLRLGLLRLGELGRLVNAKVHAEEARDALDVVKSPHRRCAAQHPLVGRFQRLDGRQVTPLEVGELVHHHALPVKELKRRALHMPPVALDGRRLQPPWIGAHRRLALFTPRAAGRHLALLFGISFARSTLLLLARGRPVVLLRTAVIVIVIGLGPGPSHGLLLRSRITSALRRILPNARIYAVLALAGHLAQHATMRAEALGHGKLGGFDQRGALQPLGVEVGDVQVGLGAGLYRGVHGRRAAFAHQLLDAVLDVFHGDAVCRLKVARIALGGRQLLADAAKRRHALKVHLRAEDATRHDDEVHLLDALDGEAVEVGRRVDHLNAKRAARELAHLVGPLLEEVRRRQHQRCARTDGATQRRLCGRLNRRLGTCNLRVDEAQRDGGLAIANLVCHHAATNLYRARRAPFGAPAQRRQTRLDDLFLDEGARLPLLLQHPPQRAQLLRPQRVALEVRRLVCWCVRLVGRQREGQRRGASRRGRLLALGHHAPRHARW
mmetsp:Transcript_19285/g.59962  ORF Transcript_19285/g.59962 Transcript_19285/m.59962 type:complete len:806 (-) Transcript_19285:3780-6197(-)